MKVRTYAALAVAVPALLVGLAQPGVAASRDVVTFGGTVQIKPTPTAIEQTLEVCFSALVPCANGAESTGAAAGLGSDVTAMAPRGVDGLEAEAKYREVCAPGTAFQPIGSATLTGRLHDAVSGQWSREISATWARYGLVAVITGSSVEDGAYGTALFTPAGVPACGVSSPVAIAGVVEVAS